MKEDKILHKRSDVAYCEGEALAPTPEQLEYGEVAVNYGVGAETIFIKNSDDKVVGLPFKRPEAPSVTPSQGNAVPLLSQHAGMIHHKYFPMNAQVGEVYHTTMIKLRGVADDYSHEFINREIWYVPKAGNECLEGLGKRLPLAVGEGTSDEYAFYEYDPDNHSDGGITVINEYIIYIRLKCDDQPTHKTCIVKHRNGLLRAFYLSPTHPQNNPAPPSKNKIRDIIEHFSHYITLSRSDIQIQYLRRYRRVKSGVMEWNYNYKIWRDIRKHKHICDDPDIRGFALFKANRRVLYCRARVNSRCGKSDWVYFKLKLIKDDDGEICQYRLDLA